MPLFTSVKFSDEPWLHLSCHVLGVRREDGVGGGERCKALSGRAGSQKIQIPAGQRVKAAQPRVCLLFQVTFSDHNT